MITFEAGFLNTIFIGLWLYFCWNCFRNFFSFVKSLGFGAPFYLLGGVTTQVIPTVLYFFALPVMRFHVFWKEELKPNFEHFLQKDATDSDDAEFPSPKK